MKKEGFLQILRSIFPFIISLLILFLLIKKIDFRNLKNAFLSGRPTLVFLAIVISVGINIFFGAFKWKRILDNLGIHLSYKESLYIRSGFLPFKIIFPMKSFELLKIFYLQKKNKISFGRGISSIILERTLNLFIISVIFFIGLLFFSDAFLKGLIFIMLVFLFGFLFSKELSELIILITKRFFPKLLNFIYQILSCFREINFHQKVILIIYSFIYQFSEFLNTYILLKSQGVDVPFFLLFVFIPPVIVVSNLPITIMGIGTRETFLVFLFSKYGQINLLLSAGILISLIEHVIPVIFGLFFIRKVMK